MGYHLKMRNLVDTVILNILKPKVFKILEYKCSPFSKRRYVTSSTEKCHVTLKKTSVCLRKLNSLCNGFPLIV